MLFFSFNRKKKKKKSFFLVSIRIHVQQKSEKE